jgi:hypothetical protein
VNDGYWYTMLPFHGVLFRTMTRAIAARAAQEEAGAMADAS